MNTGLFGFSSYYFTISATNVLGTNIPSLRLATTTLDNRAPSTISSIPLINLAGAVDLRFSWNLHPRNGGETIDGYLINVIHSINLWTLAIAAQDITESQGVTVTQAGGATGTLYTALTGTGMTSIVISTASGITFLSTADVVIGTSGTTVLHANVNTATYSVTSSTSDRDTTIAGYNYMNEIVSFRRKITVPVLDDTTNDPAVLLTMDSNVIVYDPAYSTGM